MRFLIDAQLPRRMCLWLQQAGHDARHTLDLPQGNRTADADLLRLAHVEQRTIVTKDDDFVRSHLLHGQPRKLLLLATGNIGNAELEAPLRKNLPAIERALQEGDYVEVGRLALVIHR